MCFLPIFVELTGRCVCKKKRVKYSFLKGSNKNVKFAFFLLNFYDTIANVLFLLFLTISMGCRCCSLHLVTCMSECFCFNSFNVSLAERA